LPVYSRASLSRTAAAVVALFPTTSAVARVFRATDTQSEDHPAAETPRYLGRAIAEHGGGTIEQIRAGTTPFPFRSIEHLQNVPGAPIGNEIPDSFEPRGFVGLRDHAAAQLTERIRKVE
jgi:TRAP-type C4-dicarboxylate transport system substrate-binding protein